MARVSGDEVIADPIGQRSLERRRQCGAPQHRRQDHLAARRQPAAAAAAARPARVGGRLRTAARSTARRPRPPTAAAGGEPQARRRGSSRPCPARPATARVPDRSAEEAPLRRRREACQRPCRNVYTVKGSVSLADASGGKQSIRIDWQVLDPSGKKLGTVSQQNMIPQGLAERPLGRHRRCRRGRRRRRHHQAPPQVAADRSSTALRHRASLQRPYALVKSRLGAGSERALRLKLGG